MSDRPHAAVRSRRRRHHGRPSSRDDSPVIHSDDSSVEVLPDRFDKDGRPLDRYGNIFSRSGGGKESEMVEKIVRDFGDVVDGRKTWKDMLKEVMTDASAGNPDSDGRRKRR